MKEVAAIALLSGGLDSILACRVIMDQSIRVVALRFVTPFFHDHLLEKEQQYCAEAGEKYGIDVRLVDLGPSYIEMLRNPKHGFGKNFNPCIDCKILMLQKARAMMDCFQASFLITGEVLGQRPMSQRHDTLRVIERESGCRDILLRPLCARLLPETLPEREGLVDRARLHGFSGRGRRQQIELAGKLGITEYPAPAGGCVLTDPNLSKRIRRLYQGELLAESRDLRITDIRLLMVGRHFLLPDGTWFIVGRDAADNDKITALAEEGDWLVRMTTRPGPTGLLRRAETIDAGAPGEDRICRQAAAIIIRFGRKTEGLQSAEVEIFSRAARKVFTADPPPDEEFRKWQL